MKILVNKLQFVDDVVTDVLKCGNGDELWARNSTLPVNNPSDNFVEENISLDQLWLYIQKGYGIKINCR